MLSVCECSAEDELIGSESSESDYDDDIYDLGDRAKVTTTILEGTVRSRGSTVDAFDVGAQLMKDEGFMKRIEATEGQHSPDALTAVDRMRTLDVSHASARA